LRLEQEFAPDRLGFLAPFETGEAFFIAISGDYGGAPAAIDFFFDKL
jgi:hypothetical protein